ncbi:hypothetical protein D047_1295A, partial [Vibrio parahaemolyticus VPTS-2010_2]|jgi:hypothetical protein
MYKLK